MILALPGNLELAASLAERLDGDLGQLTMRRFPDGETYVRVETPLGGRHVVLACTLDRPDQKTVPLLLLAATVQDLGAARVGLVAPYLAYLRQDRRFQPGEGITSLYFGRLLSGFVDWLVTIDPHLHRLASLADVYSIPTAGLHASPLVSEWIRANMSDAVLIGPDVESVQWVRAVAARAGVPFLILEKIRRGDRDVEVSLPDVVAWKDRTPLLVDDIISTGRTMIATIRQLARLHLGPPVCIGVHAVFAEGAYEELLAAGPTRLVTCNTIPHPSNAIDVGDVLADGVREMERLHG